MIENVRQPRVQRPVKAKSDRSDFDVIRLMRRYWLLIGICLVAGWMLAIAYTIVTPPTYESKASIMLIPKDTTLTAKGVEGSRDTSGVIAEDILATHVMLIRSHRLVSTALSEVRNVQIVDGKVVMLPKSMSKASHPITSHHQDTDGVKLSENSASRGILTATVPASGIAVQNEFSNEPATSPFPDKVAASSATEFDSHRSDLSDGEDSSEIESAEIKSLRLEDLESLVSAKSHKDRTVADYVLRNLTVTRGGEGQSRNAQVLTIAFQHSNAEDARLVVDGIMQEFQRYLSENFADKNNQAAMLIQNATTRLSRELEDATKEYSKFRQESPMLWSKDQISNVHKDELDQLLLRLREIKSKKIEVQNRLELVQTAIKEIDEKHLPDAMRLALVDDKSAQRFNYIVNMFVNDSHNSTFMADQPLRMALATERARLTNLQGELSAQATTLGEQNIVIQSTRAKIAEAEERIRELSESVQLDENRPQFDAKALVAAYIRMLKTDLLQLEVDEQRLTYESEVAREEAKKLVKFEVEGETLQKNLQQKQDLFNETLNRLRDINLTKDYAGYVHEILRDASDGEEVWPSLTICLILGTLVGFGMSTTGIAFTELLNRSLRSTDEIETITGVPIMSYIPRLHHHEDREYLKEIEDSGSRLHPIVYTVHAPRSQEAEIFRGLRTNLFFKSAEIRGKVFEVTSANSGDGKSTMTANTVTSIAQSGRKVILLECDLRRPAVAALLGCANHQGLSELLNGKVSLENAIQKSEVDNLFVLSAGSPPENPAELLGSIEFRNLIEKLREDFDFVILDCPPVLAVSDPCIVSDVADGVIVVVRVNPKSRVELQRTVAMLRDVQATIVGTIVNASHLEDEGAVGKDGYYMGYGYGTYGQRANGYYTRPAARRRTKKVESSRHSGQTR